MICVTITDKDGTSTELTFDKYEIMIGRVKDERNDIVLRAAKADNAKAAADAFLEEASMHSIKADYLDRTR